MSSARLLANIRTANASAFSSTSTTPVAVFVAGTGGIGRAMAEAFARHVRGNARIVVLGRNQAAAENVISTFPESTSPGSKYDFIPVDASLMKNVKTASSSLLSLLGPNPKINYLVMSQGYMTTAGRTETEEGIDRKLAVHYYSRWAFINELMPALENAVNDGEEVKVYNVLAAGQGAEIDLNDLGLKTTYSLVKAARQSPTYTDLMMEKLAALHPKITFIHAYPGTVDTKIMPSSPSTLYRLVGPPLFALLRLLGLIVSPDDCAEYMLSAMYRCTPGRAHRIHSDGSDLGKKAYFGNDEVREKLWEHSKEVTGVTSVGVTTPLPDVTR